ncbi:MAG: ribulose-phosphate 3-epimerase [Micrococcales bacterium]|nr:ribulose-phosphate 3-epimerase [Micrococcales bacterium]
MSIRIAPSILAADLSNLTAEMGRVATADLIHVDVMDGVFVPNLTMGQPVVERLGQVSPLPLDVHLMISEPDRWALDFALPGVEMVTFHLEAATGPVRLANHLHQAGVKVGLAINPGTPVAWLEDLIDEIDVILVMGVEPGFAGQDFIERSIDKLTQARALAAQANHPVSVELDGGANRQRMARIVAAGADIVVAGAAVFGAEDPAGEVSALRRAVDGPKPRPVNNHPKPGPRPGPPPSLAFR